MRLSQCLETNVYTAISHKQAGDDGLMVVGEDDMECSSSIPNSTHYELRAGEFRIKKS